MNDDDGARQSAGKKNTAKCEAIMKCIFPRVLA